MYHIQLNLREHGKDELLAMVREIGDKQGYLEATVEYALRRPELRERFLSYLRNIVK